MSAVLIFAFVFAMPRDGFEEFQIFTKTMPAAACAAHVEKMKARYASGGRWAQGYRHFDIRCVEVTSEELIPPNGGA